MDPSISSSTPTPEGRGTRRAEEELAKQPPAIDLDFFAPDGEPWCRFSIGTTECLNQHACLNPRHNIPTCKRCGWQWDNSGEPPKACPRCACSKCGWPEHPHPCDTCKGNLYLEPADPKDPWNVDPRIKTDKWGRYVLPHPITGEDTHFTRVTTAADTLDDKYGIIGWKNRGVAYGMGQRPDLVTLAASAASRDDKEILDQVVTQALHAAASDRKANLGNALHAFTQRIDRGEEVKVPKDYLVWITRYKTAVAQHRLTFLRDFIEAVVCLPNLGLCGTMDRGAEWPHSPLPVIYDLKTGSLDYDKVKIAQQLAAYSRSTHRRDLDVGRWYEMPRFNQDVALVLHQPAEGDVEPRLFKVNIDEGWRLLNMSMDVRGLRSGKGKHLFTEITADALPTPTANREEELRQRVERIVQAPAAKQALLGLWARDVPTLKEGGLSDAQLDLVEGWCAQVEREHGLT